MSKYKAVLSNKSFYEEVCFGDPSLNSVRIGTEMDCNVRLHKEWFLERFWIEFVGYEGEWSVRCSDNLFFFTGDVRRLTRASLEGIETLNVRYSNNNLDAFAIDIFNDYGNASIDFRKIIDLNGVGKIAIGTQQSNDVVLSSEFLGNESYVLLKDGNRYVVRASSYSRNLFINGNRIPNGGYIGDHDFLSIADIPFYYCNGKLWTETGNKVNSPRFPYYVLPARTGYPKFTRSTREKIVLCSDEIEILDPPEKPQKPRNSIVMSLLPSLGMLATSGLMATMGGQMMGYSLISGGMAIVIAIAGIIQNKKDYTKDIEERESKYLSYEQTKRNEINQARISERNDREKVYLDITTEQNRLVDYSYELFDRSPEDEDFLAIRIGTGIVDPIRKINHKKQEKLETDGLFEIPERIAKEYEKLSDAPVAIDLKSINAVGLIGRESDRYGMLKNIIYDLSTRQFPIDYELYLIVKPENYTKLSWLRFLPALNYESATGRNIACDDESRNRIFDQLYAELSQREENQEFKRIIVVFYDAYGFLTHPASRFVKDAKKYNCTFVFLGDNKKDVPMYCDYTICMDSPNSGKVIDVHDVSKEVPFNINPVSEASVKEMVQILAPVYADQITLEGTLTQNLTLYQLLGIFSAEDLNLKQRWREHSAEKSMAVPIGVTSNDVVWLDLHDKAHGPHGLVAGTTGSGKSELLQTYILSIAVNYHPYDVGFVLIDFKGGGMANQFSNLPHLLGTITNIDGKEVNRSLKFIKAELERRQRYFGEAGVNHIDKYIKAFKEGSVSEPLPHLVLIVDEFAELKAQQPDFMQELISAARIGRSLGVHLILATQKPAGQVDDQIWSNSRFKLCLKVQDAEDSNEVLKTPVAAEIKEPGRAYLQVGNNEIFELFQSAYSGAAENTFDAKQSTFSIYEVGAAGKRKSVYQQKGQQGGESRRTQLEALVQYLGEVFALEGDGKAHEICLPPLKTNIPYMKERAKAGGAVCIGYYDDPEHQRQPMALIDIENKNTFIAGSAQYGKTNLLLSMIRSILENDTPRESSIYIMDFNSMILKQFEGVNHVGGVVTPSEDEKLNNLMKLLEEELVLRKEKMTSVGVSSYSAYREAGYDDLPHIFIFVDNILAGIELYFEDDERLLHILREGLSVGISVIATSLQTGGISFRYSSNFANKIAFFCNDSDEYSNLFDSSVDGPDEYPGRCILAIEKTNVECQTYLAFPGEKEIDRITNMRSFCERIKERYAGSEKVKKIPFIPSWLTSDVLMSDYNAKRDVTNMPIGLTYKEVAPFIIDLGSLGIIGLCGDKEGIKGTFLECLFASMETCCADGKSPYRVVLLDDISRSLEPLKNYPFVQEYSFDVSKTVSTVEPLYDELSKRYDLVMDGESIDKEDMIIYVIHNNDFAKMIEEDYDLRDKFEEINSKYREMRVLFIFSNYNNAAVSYSGPLPITMIKDKQQVLFFEDLASFKPFDISYDVLRDNKKKIERGDAFYMQGEDVIKLKLAL